jgi:hypothetical protein
LFAYFLKEKLNQISLNITNVLWLDIDIGSKTSINMSNKGLKYIDSRTFNALINLKGIYFYGNLIQEIHAETFKSLTNLNCINFCNNQIKQLDSNIFKGLEANLERIYFGNNQIKVIHNPE